jgi:branched-chain amino acid transport system ATP-binding protein
LDGTPILSDVSLTLENSEIIAVLGANGSGKTTLLRAISGLVKPASGEIWFKGSRIDPLPPYRIVEKGIVQVPAGRKLFSTLSVNENLELGSYIKRARKERKKTLNMVFELFPVLKDKKNAVAGSLSGGEQQMLAIARALMSLPHLLMLDEPCLGLAPDIATEVYETVHKINEKAGISVLLVDHNIQSALNVTRRGYVLANGAIVVYGQASDILRTIESDLTRYL